MIAEPARRATDSSGPPERGYIEPLRFPWSTQAAGRVSAAVDPGRTAAGLLAFVDGLASHVQNLHTAETAQEVLAQHLDLVFAGDPPT